MPLPPAPPREHLHTRAIELKGYRRSDGLWDIEGHLRDTKTYAFSNEFRGQVTPGMALHEMWVRLTLDERFEVHDVVAVTDGSPFRICAEAAPNFHVLKGERIGRGWNRRVKELLGNTSGCTHIVEMLPQLATVAIQTVRAARRASKNPHQDKSTVDPKERAPQLDTCYAWSTEREVVRRWLPEFYTGKP